MAGKDVGNRFHAGLHRWSILLACCTLLLVVAGGMVTSRDAGLSVPDWPLSYGKLMPPMEGGILYEHGHRMIATTVGMLTIVLDGLVAQSGRTPLDAGAGHRRAGCRNCAGRAGRHDGALSVAVVDFYGARQPGAVVLFDDRRHGAVYLRLVVAGRTGS